MLAYEMYIAIMVRPDMLSHREASGVHYPCPKIHLMRLSHGSVANNLRADISLGHFAIFLESHLSRSGGVHFGPMDTERVSEVTFRMYIIIAMTSVQMCREKGHVR
jgi:hypothetical protein